jgi:hypothetical protein
MAYPCLLIKIVVCQGVFATHRPLLNDAFHVSSIFFVVASKGYCLFKCTGSIRDIAPHIVGNFFP